MERTFNFEAIWKGWKAYLTNENSPETIRRAKICQICPNAVDGTYEKLMPDYTLKKLQGKKCNQCGCPLSTLLRQDDKKCELKKW
jgi:hypothetical protein